MKKKVVLFCSFAMLLLLVSCGADSIEYEGSKRVTASGKLVTSAGAALGDVEVELNVVEQYNEDVLNKVRSRNDGTFLANFPIPEENQNVQFYATFEKEGYVTKAIYNTSLDDIEDLKYDLETVDLYRIDETVEVRIFFAAAAANRFLISYEIIPDAAADFEFANIPDPDRIDWSQYDSLINATDRILVKNSNITVKTEVEVEVNGQRTIELNTVVVNAGATSGAINILY